MLKDPRKSPEYRLLKFLDKGTENYNIQWCCILAYMKPEISETTTKETLDALMAKNPPFISRKDHKKNPNQLELGYTITTAGQDRIKEFSPDIEAHEKEIAPEPVNEKTKNWLSGIDNTTIVGWVVAIVLSFGGGGWAAGFAWSQYQIDRGKFDLEQENKGLKRQRDSVFEALTILQHTQNISKGKTDSTKGGNSKP